MKNTRRAVLAALSAVFLLATVAGPADAGFGESSAENQTTQQAAAAQIPPAGRVASGIGNLQMYEATVDIRTLQSLVDGGYDVTALDNTPDGVRVALVLSPGERRALAGKGLGLSLKGRGREETAQAAATAAGDSIYGWTVFRSYDEPGGIEDQLQEIGNRPQNRGFLKLFDIGDSIQGRDIWAIRMTQGARGLPLGRRPAVLFQGTTHAREWISTEVAMRLLEWFVAERRAENPEVVSILETSELWFVPVVNPDGYEFTFTTERLWRKNLRDNDGNGEITNNDGVDVNRNYPEHWNYDEEGSSSQFSSETYRGAAAASEPENQSNINLIRNMGDFKFAVSYHSFGQLLLYPQGWQTLTSTADDAIYLALTGIDTNPAVEGFNPGVGADLYTTNGEFTDWAHGEEGVLAWTPELSDHGQGFEFPDDEALVQEEFQKNLNFAVNVAKSATDPDDPVSHWGMDTAGLYVDLSELDPWKTNWPQSDLRVQTSYAGGISQTVEVLAKRATGSVTLHYTINGGTEQTAPTSPSPNGEVYGGNNAYNTYYHYLRGDIGPLAEGDSVVYWFTGGTESTDPVTFTVQGDGTADVLVVAAEDRTGLSNSPPYPAGPGPHWLSYYTDAITATGRTVEVYDVDAMSRQAPDHLGVLNHYEAVVWYTGNDVVTRENAPGWGPGDVSRLAVDMTLGHREYLNNAGNLMYTGQRAGFVENGFAGGQFYDPVANEPCVVGGEEGPVFGRCLLWGDKNDFIQYYLGAFIYNSHDGAPTDPIEGTADPFTGMSWSLNGPGTADNQNHHASLLTTSSFLPKSEYPQFTSDARANYTGAGGNPFEPFDGDWYVYSQQADVSYKQLKRAFTMPAGGGDMTFRISYDTEPNWDFVFVEIHNLANDTWVTAPDLNGHTSNDTGESCPAGWFELHPWLEQYQGSDCSGSGTSGDWNASSGRSDGWEEWLIDLDAFAAPGESIEIYISYASDWAIQGLGTFVDYIQMPGEAVESFESDLGAWEIAGPPPGSAPNPNNFIRTQSVGFEEGAIVSETPTTANFSTLFYGFGFEAIQGATGPNSRADVMDKSLGFLGA